VFTRIRRRRGHEAAGRIVRPQQFLQALAHPDVTPAGVVKEALAIPGGKGQRVSKDLFFVFAGVAHE